MQMVVLISYWFLVLNVLQELRRLNNFAGMFVINAAFESASVFRLKQTFKVRINLIVSLYCRVHSGLPYPLY